MLPPSGVTWRAFIDDCADPAARPQRVPDTISDEYDERVFVRWDRFCTAFSRWLERQGASVGVQKALSREWLRYHVEHQFWPPQWNRALLLDRVSQGHLILDRVAGTQYVFGVSLRASYDVPSPTEVAHPRTGWTPARARADKKQRGDARERYLELRARQQAGMRLSDAEQQFLSEYTR